MINFREEHYQGYIFISPSYLKYENPLLRVFRTNHALVKNESIHRLIHLEFGSYVLGVL